MAVDQFCLKWNNFQSSIVNAFGSLQSTEDLADVTLSCEGVCIKAHKIILSACSPYFRTVFKNNPCPHPIVILKDVLYSDLLAVLNFMYHGEVLISQDALVSFLQTAETLQVSGLMANAALQDLPVKLTACSTRVNSKLVKPPKAGESTKSLQDKIKLAAAKPKVIKSNRISGIARTLEYAKFVDEDINSENSTLSSKLIDNTNLDELETTVIDNIKTEMVEDIQGDHNFNDQIDVYQESESSNTQNSSILEAALEVKELQPSILERSLTSYLSKLQPAVSYSPDNVSILQQSPPQPDNLYSSKKIEVENERQLKHKLQEANQSKSFDFSAESSQTKYLKLDEEGLRNVEINIQGLSSDISILNVKSVQDVQPHHSSQCGNCPHCGKIYSNQSALKYHVRLVHSDLTNMYCCHLCPEAFDYREGYKKHMIDVHNIRN